MNFYQIFNSLCRERGETPSGVGQKMGVSKAAVNYWKEGHIPKHETLSKIADYFNVSINYLIGESTERQKTINGDDIAKVALFGGDSDVTEEMWAEVKEFVKYVKSKHGKD